MCEALGMRIGVLGGTGPAGQGIALRMADQGHDVVLGSRDAARSAGIVAELQAKWGARVASLSGGTNADAAGAELVVLATVWDAAVETAAAFSADLAGKTLISMANGLEKGPREMRPVIPSEGSVSAAVQKAAPEARVVAAFHLIPASELGDLDHPLHTDGPDQPADVGGLPEGRCAHRPPTFSSTSPAVTIRAIGTRARGRWRLPRWALMQ